MILDTGARILLVPLGSCTFLPDPQSSSVASQLLVFAARRNLRFEILYQRRPTLLEFGSVVWEFISVLFSTGCLGFLPSSLATVHMTRQHPSTLDARRLETDRYSTSGALDTMMATFQF